jgi:hypothetical protein
MVLFMAGNVGVAVFERLGIKPFVQRKNELRIFAGKMNLSAVFQSSIIEFNLIGFGGF